MTKTEERVNQDTEIILSSVRAEIDRSGISQGQVAKEAGLSAATLTQLLNGSYGANPGKQVAKLERWIAAREHEAAQPKMPAAPVWTATPTAERVIAALGYAQMAGDIAVVYGGAGLGKTTACNEYRRRYPNVWIATMSPATASIAAALEEICYALGMKSPPQGAARMQREILRRIRDTNGLLVIDEAQHLTVSALDGLRALHDATGIGLALVGNEAVYTSMTGGSRAAYLDRLFSRIGKRVKLTRATKMDIERLAAALGVDPDDKKSLSFLNAVGTKAGALRSVVKVVRLATLIAGGQQPGLSDIEAAWKDLGV